MMPSMAVKRTDPNQSLFVRVLRWAMRGRGSQIKAMEDAAIDSPRGKWKMSKAHNPVQNFYLREVKNGVNEVVKLAAANLADPAKGCSM